MQSNDDNQSLLGFMDQGELDKQAEFGDMDHAPVDTTPVPPVPSAPSTSSDPIPGNEFGLKQDTEELIRQRDDERINILNRLSRLSAQGKLGNLQYTSTDTLESLKRVNQQATHLGRAAIMIKMMQRAIIFLGQGAEYLTQRFPNKFVDLEGYGAFLRESIDQYVEILYEIYEYHSEVFTSTTPLLTLAMALVSNAAMYSVHRKMLTSTSKLGETSETPHAESMPDTSSSSDDELMDDNFDEAMQHDSPQTFAAEGEGLGLLEGEDDLDLEGAEEVVAPLPAETKEEIPEVAEEPPAVVDSPAIPNEPEDPPEEAPKPSPLNSLAGLRAALEKKRKRKSTSRIRKRSRRNPLDGRPDELNIDLETSSVSSGFN